MQSFFSAGTVCVFFADGEIAPLAVDESTINDALNEIPGVFPSSVTITDGKVEISGTISAPRWWPDPGNKIHGKLESLGIRKVSVGGYY